MRNWEELLVAYLSRFFPHALTSERREEIIAFKQREDESLYNARERYKQLLRRCMFAMNYICILSVFFMYLHNSNA